MSFGCKIWRPDGSTITLDGRDRMNRVIEILTLNHPGGGFADTGILFQAYTGMSDDGTWAVVTSDEGVFASVTSGGFNWRLYNKWTPVGTPPQGQFLIVKF